MRGGMLKFQPFRHIKKGALTDRHSGGSGQAKIGHHRAPWAALIPTQREQLHTTDD